jgi:hypothetical protein
MAETCCHEIKLRTAFNMNKAVLTVRSTSCQDNVSDIPIDNGGGGLTRLPAILVKVSRHFQGHEQSLLRFITAFLCLFKQRPK